MGAGSRWLSGRGRMGSWGVLWVSIAMGAQAGPAGSGAVERFHGLVAGTAPAPAPERFRAHARPVLFEINQGQMHGDAAFSARLGAVRAFFTPGGIVLAVPRADGAAPEAVRLRFAGASEAPRIAPRGAAAARSHYLGRGVPGDAVDIPLYREIVYEQLYPGIDLRLHGSGGRLEYDFVLAPGADPDRIRLQVLGGEGAGIDAHGNHVITTAAGARVMQMKPRTWQERGDERVMIPSRFESLGAHGLGFRVAAYDRDRPLVIDPVLNFSTYLGGSLFDRAEGVALDPAGNVYITGQTLSVDFPLAGAMDDQAGGSFDVFVQKYNASGSALVYSTYIAGEALDIANAIDVDAAGNAYITGETASDDFPETKAFGTGSSGTFVVKLNPQGAGILYATHLRALQTDGYDVAVDGAGRAHVTGHTASTSFPTMNAFQSERGGGFDAFVAKLDAGGNLLYSTYLGGGEDENLDAAANDGIGIALDAAGNAYVTGDTESADFPVKNAFQAALAGAQDAFVAKLNPAGGLVYATYLGGSDNGTTHGERGLDIDVDAGGRAYVVGQTRSTDFPTHRALQGALGDGPGDQDAFVTALNAQGTGLVYSTYLGGDGADVPDAAGVSVDDCGNAYLAGTTNSGDFALEDLAGGISGTRVFLSKLEAGGQALLFSASLGNGGSARVAGGAGGDAWVAGHTFSDGFPTMKPLQATRAGDADGFLARVFHTRAVGDAPGAYHVCRDEWLRLRVERNPDADPGREWLAFRVMEDGVPSPIYFVTPGGLEAYTPGTPVGGYTPYPYMSNTVVQKGNLAQLGLASGDQLAYAYVYEQDGVLDLSHVVFVNAR